jgi:hypothetical protein
MATEYITNAHDVRFYIERAGDFDDNGRFIWGRGWFAGLVVGNDELSGVWFDTRNQALSAISNYQGAA